MTDKFFPIKTTPACKLKWTWSTLWLTEGTTASCHRCIRHTINPDDFENFHNTKQKLEQRTKMLNGIWPSEGGCEYCEKVEKLGGDSDRLFHLKIPNQVPPELDDDPTAINVTPRILEVFLSTTCNMRCIYCRPTNSSRIKKEFDTYGEFPVLGNIYSKRSDRPGASDRIEHYDKLVEGFWKWLETNYVKLERLHILGGETFLQDEFKNLVEFFDTHPNPNIEINVVSNLSIDKKLFQDYLMTFKRYVDEGKIKRFDLTASIDTWGEEQAYIRSGINLDLFESNMNWLVEQEEYWLRVNINQTVTGLGIRSMPLLFAKLAEWRKKRSLIGHYHQKVTGFPWLDAEIWPKGYWDDVFDEILAAMPTSNWDEEETYKQMVGFINKTKRRTEFNKEQFENCITYLDELDRRRNTNWREVFPDLVYIEQNYLDANI